MPPAFNLSQDQTLQFDLEIQTKPEDFVQMKPMKKTENERSPKGNLPFTDFLFMSVCVARTFVLHRPNAHAYRL